MALCALLAVVLLTVQALAVGSAGASGLYVASFFSSAGPVSPFSIGPSGAPSPIPCSPPSNCATASNPEGLSIAPSGRFLYVANDGANSLSAFAIGGGGTLSPIACKPAANCQTGAAPIGTAVDPSGRFVYVANSQSSNVSVFAIGGDGSLSPIACQGTNCQTGTNPQTLAVDPSGRFLYVGGGSGFNGGVSVFAIAGDGSLSPVTCSPASNCTAGFVQQDAVDPAGKFLYAASEGGSGNNGVLPFAIGAGGALSRIACSTCGAGSGTDGVAIHPSGRFLYAVALNTAQVFAFTVGASGALSPIACSPASNCAVPAGSHLSGLAMEPSGRFLYATDQHSSTVYAFAIASNGSLSPIACTPGSNCQVPSGPNLQGIAASPDRGPTAAFTASPGVAGTLTAFDASRSTSPDYPISSYTWSFGDGQSEVTASPSVQHAYALPGKYSVTLTVGDGAGCSQTVVYTGQTASCNGSAKAQSADSVTVGVLPGTAPGNPNVQTAAVDRLRLSPSTFAAASHGPAVSAASAHPRRRKFGAKVTYQLNETATVRFTVQQALRGRKAKHGGCARPTKRNRKGHKCIRLRTLRGGFTLVGRAGANSFRFSGRLAGKRLKPGKYRLMVIPSAGGRSGRPIVQAFRIVP